MAEVIRMPRMSDTMEEGVIVAWHKKIGDTVKTGELLAEIETDKATMDFESPNGGVLLHIGAEKGKPVLINAILAIVGEKGEDVSAFLKQEPAKQPEKKAEPAAAPAAVEAQPVASVAVAAPPSSEPDTTTTNGKVKASPLAKRIAKEKGISLTQVTGTGDEGRIVKRDVETFKGTLNAPAFQPVVGEEGFTDISLTQMRKTIAKRLVASKFTAPHFYLTMEINMDKAMDMRKDLNEAQPVKVSFNDMIVKAAALALRKHPAVNASWMEDRIRQQHHIHIGIAVAVEQGLLVPVIKFADAKSFPQIAEETNALAGKAKGGTLKLDEMQGNTFTISNLGMFDIDEFTAIINSPEACILAIGKIKETPVLKDGALKNTHTMKVTLSCDHRVVDGVTGARFLQTFKQFLESPVRMLI